MNVITRRSFLDHCSKVGLLTALATLTDIPLVMKRALAEGTIGQGTNKKKLLFIFLRGANDGLNSLIPIKDPAYYAARPLWTSTVPNLGMPGEADSYYDSTGGCDWAASGINPTFDYSMAIRLGNGFAALHPSLKFLAPVYNAGDLALIHRVGYPRQSRSHFDSQNYWETGRPGNNLAKDGIFYRTMIESGLANTAPLTGVSIQSSLPLILRGSQAAMTNLTDPTRYNLLGIPNTTGDAKADAALRLANGYPFPDKRNRDLLNLQYQNVADTLQIFASLNFSEAGNTFVDNENTDNYYPYYLFPTTNTKNGGYVREGGVLDPNKYVVDTGAYSFFNNLKAAALILNKTDALIAGTEMSGFDTHSLQGGPTGSHANLQRRIGWAMYALRKYFTTYADKATWNNLIVVTLSEFGRTTVQNSDKGTDHAEASLMWVAGGAVKGYGKSGRTSAVYNCGPSDSVPWITGTSGSMYGISGRYLKRCTDYRSVLGEIIRDHLGATGTQLGRIIPGYTNESQEHLLSGGTVVSPIESGSTTTPITGELDIV